MMSLKEATNRLKFIEDEIAATKRLVAEEEARTWPEGTPEFKTHYWRRRAPRELATMEKAAADGRAWIAQNYPENTKREG